MFSSSIFFFSYIQYSAVCARTLRRCLKSTAAKEAMKREESYVRVNKWQGGKISDQVHPASMSTIDILFRMIFDHFSFAIV